MISAYRRKLPLNPLLQKGAKYEVTANWFQYQGYTCVFV